MLFVLLHETAHVSITQMGLPVLGRIEDAADTYAALRLIRSGSNFSRRVLIEAAEGWFMADRRDQKMGDKVGPTMTSMGSTSSEHIKSCA
jgi:hypothetical protein